MAAVLAGMRGLLDVRPTPAPGCMDMTTPIPPHQWPNALDLTVTGLFLILVVALPAIGYVFMAIDFRAHLRSLRRGLVLVARSMPEVPGWACRETPRSIAALGLRFPCSEEDLKRAYRKRVKQLHPDHGGDQRRFLILQSQFEEALAIVAGRSPSDLAGWSSRRRAG
jgi:hypothetical protein